MSRSSEQSDRLRERDDAIRVANAILDRRAADPDDDLNILARQFVRADEAANTYDELLTRAAVLLAAARYPGDITTEQWGVALAEARRHIEEPNEAPPEEAALDAAFKENPDAE